MAIAYNAIGAVSDNGAATTLSPALPATTAGILIASVQTSAVQAHSCSTPGWTQVHRQDGTGITTTIWASNGGAAPTFTWASSTNCRAVIAQYADGASDLSYGTAIGNYGIDTDPVSVSGITSTVNSSIALTVVCMRGNTNTNPPSGWTEDFYSLGVSTSARDEYYSKALATSGTAAGTFTTNAPGSSSNWTAIMFEIKPGAISSGTRRRQLVNVN